MTARIKPSRPALIGNSRARAPRDLRTMLARFSEFMAVGLVAVSLFIRHPNDLNHPNSPSIGMDNLATLPLKIAFVAVHTRTVWVLLAVLSTLIAVLGYRARKAARRSPWVTFSPIVVVLIVALHAGAQAYLQSHGTLKIESHGPVVVNPAEPTFQPQGITRITVTEGTSTQWRALFGGDLLFSAPLCFAWVLSLIRRREAFVAPPSPLQ